jgi:hypothetical protein
MEHTKCALSTVDAEGNSDDVFIAASAGEYDGKIWWMTYRLYEPPQVGTVEQCATQIEIARLLPSCANSMFGATVHNVNRFAIGWSEHNDPATGSRVVAEIAFPSNREAFTVANPKRMYDYADS